MTVIKYPLPEPLPPEWKAAHDQLTKHIKADMHDLSNYEITFASDLAREIMEVVWNAIQEHGHTNVH